MSALPEDALRHARPQIQDLSTESIADLAVRARELGGVIPTNTRRLFDIREIIARVVDDRQARAGLAVGADGHGRGRWQFLHAIQEGARSRHDRVQGEMVVQGDRVDGRVDASGREQGLDARDDNRRWGFARHGETLHHIGNRLRFRAVSFQKF